MQSTQSAATPRRLTLNKGLPFVVNMPPERRADLLFRTGNPGNESHLLTHFIVNCNSFLKQCFSFYENKVFQLMSAGTL